MAIARTFGVLTFCLGMTLTTATSAATQQTADAMLAAQDWSGSAKAYVALLRLDPHHGGNWFNLGQSRHQLGQYEDARRAYQTSLANNPPAPGRVRLNLARVLMAMGRRDEALGEIQRLAGTAVSHRTLLSTPEFGPLLGAPEFRAVVATQTPCNTPEYRQFDFWLGEWDIVPMSPGAPAGGQNSITVQQDGCVVLERYTNGAFTGMSLNFYDSARRVWHQSWMSNQGGMLYLEGSLNADGAMEMSDRGLATGAAAGTVNRTTWTQLKGGGVRQHWEVSSDNGATWTTVYDGRYVPRAKTDASADRAPSPPAPGSA